MFNIGDKISYPMYGSGVILSIELKNLLGEDKYYYNIEFLNSKLKLSVPVDNALNLGIRSIISKDDLQAVFSVLKGDKSFMPDNWNRRYRQNIELLKSGDILDIACVVRNLLLLGEKKSLSNGDRNILNKAVELLSSEIMLVSDSSKKDTLSFIKSCVFGDV